MKYESILRGVLIALGIFVIVIILVFHYDDQEEREIISEKEALQTALLSKICMQGNVSGIRSHGYYNSNEQEWGFYLRYPDNYTKLESCDPICIVDGKTKRTSVDFRC